MHLEINMSFTEAFHFLDSFLLIFLMFLNLCKSVEK